MADCRCIPISPILTAHYVAVVLRQLKAYEAADRLATGTHYNSSVADSTLQDPQAHGPAWVQLWAEEALSDLDTLRSHAPNQAQLAQTQSLSVINQTANNLRHCLTFSRSSSSSSCSKR